MINRGLVTFKLLLHTILLLTFLLPPLAWLGIVYLGSLLILLMHSFFYLDGYTGQIVYEFSFSTLIELFTQRANIDIIIRTVMMAFSVTLGATIIGLPVAYYMAKFTTKKTKAIMLAHTLGNPFNLEKIVKIK